MNFYSRLIQYDGFTKTEQHLRSYILANPDKLALMNTRQLAQASFTSPAAVVRFCQKLGMKGLSEFKNELIPCMPKAKESVPDYNFPFNADMSSAEVTQSILDIEIDALQKQRALIDNADIDRAVDMMMNAEQIDLFALGTSLRMGDEFAFRMFKLGKEVSVIEDNVRLKYIARQMGPHRCALVISYSGTSETLSLGLNAITAQKEPVIAITARMDSPVAKSADIVLPIYSLEDDNLKSAPFASAAAQKVILDILYAHVFQRDYEENLRLVTEDADNLLKMRKKVMDTER